MSVLKLNGKPIDWSNPPSPTTRTLWSRRDRYGRQVTGSLRTIAHLDHLDSLARKQFGVGITVFQPPYNKGVAASAGTHDYDACLDGWINGVPGEVQQTFFRNNGAGAYLRKPPKFSLHIHWFTLPPREGRDVSDDYREAGFKVGKYVDGGWSLYGRRTTSSQIEDYYQHKTALAGHYHDPSYFPPNIPATIFNLNRYIEQQRKAMKPKKKNKVIGLFWNLLVGRKPARVATELTSLIRTNGRPKFVIVAEARGYRWVIKSLGTVLRYKVHQPKDIGKKPVGVQVREAGSTAILIKRNQDILASGEIRCTKRWTGPNGMVHEGRVFPWDIIKIDGKWTLVLGVHRVTGKNGKNREAWNEEDRLIEDLIRSKSPLDGSDPIPFIIPGDWNDPWASSDKRSPRALASRLGGKIKHAAARLDYILKRGVAVAVSQGSKRGSDHPAIRIIKK